MARKKKAARLGPVAALRMVDFTERFWLSPAIVAMSVHTLGASSSPLTLKCSKKKSRCLAVLVKVLLRDHMPNITGTSVSSCTRIKPHVHGFKRRSPCRSMSLRRPRDLRTIAPIVGLAPAACQQALFQRTPGTLRANRCSPDLSTSRTISAKMLLFSGRRFSVATRLN